MTRGETVYWYHGDGLGSVTEVTDAIEDVVEQYVYDSFGNLHVYDGSGNPLSQTAIGNYFTYIGREYDQESGLYYLRARYYSPEQGRFLARDPMRTSILSASSSQNLYRYADNNPTSRKDPSGLSPQCHAESIFWRRSEITDPAAPTATFEAWTAVDKSCRCKYIQQMSGDFKELPTNRCIRASHAYWDGPTVPLLCFDSWVVDYSATQQGAYYPTVPTTDKQIYMSDRPRLGLGQNPRRCTLTFSVAVYTYDEKAPRTHWADPITGRLYGPDPVGEPIYWYFHWETDKDGNFLWKSR